MILGSAHFDEALGDDGLPLAPYAELLATLRDLGLSTIAARTTARAAAAGFGLGTGGGFRALPVDPVPRVLTADEWAVLERGVVQRARMLEALLGDLRGARRAGVPEEVVASSPYDEPWLRDAPAPERRLGIIGFDVVRRPDGTFAVLEDNLLTPGHAAVAGLRPLLEVGPPAAGLPVADVARPTRAALGRMLAADGDVAILADVPGDRASWELRWLGAALGVPVLGLQDLRADGGRVVVRATGRPLALLWQRTSEDRLHDDAGGRTPLGDLLLGPLLAGGVRVVNQIGCGVADDKRMFDHTPAATVALLGEEAVLPIVPGIDLSDPERCAEALDEPDAYAFKPRNGAGGRGVALPPHDGEALAALRRALAREPGHWVAQRHVPLSRHPTVVDGELVPRPVDLRLFAVHGPDGWTAIPGGVSRFPTRAGTELVNTSGGGGVKDVWILER